MTDPAPGSLLKPVYQKDYILFMVEQFGRLLRKLIQYITEGRFDDATFEIEQVYRQYLGINSDLINRMPYQSLMLLQQADPETYHDKCIVLAELLRLEGDIFSSSGVLREALGRYTRSLCVYLTVLLDEPEERFSEYKERVPELESALKPVLAGLNENMPGECAELLRQYKEIA